MSVPSRCDRQADRDRWICVGTEVVAIPEPDIRVRLSDSTDESAIHARVERDGLDHPKGRVEREPWSLAQFRLIPQSRADAGELGGLTLRESLLAPRRSERITGGERVVDRLGDP